MCFSATASFVAGGALTAVGVATVSKVKNKRDIPLASIPLLFGVQQLLDGVVWLSFGTPLLHTVTVYAYAFLAFVWWPLYIPGALLPLETDRGRREILQALSVVGLGVSSFFLYFLVSGTVTAQIVNHCVSYHTPHPYRLLVLAFYLIATCGPFLVSSKKIFNVFGVVLLVSFFIAGWFYFETFSSVWCFFAATLSLILYGYFRDSSNQAS